MSDELTKQVASLRALARKMKRYSVDMVDLTYVENVEWCADALTAAEQRAEQLQAERDEAVKRLAAMREALAKYGEHYRDCDRYGWRPDASPTTPCTCGLDAAMEGGG